VSTSITDVGENADKPLSLVRVTELTAHHSTRRARDIALITDEGHLTWRELDARVRHAAVGLRASGMNRGDAFAVIGRGHSAIVETVLAAAQTGTIAVVIDGEAGVDAMTELFREANVKLAFVESEFESTVDDVRARLDELVTIITVGDVHGSDEYEVWLETHETSESMYESARAVARATPDDTFLRLYTAGVTAEPRGVAVSQRGICGHADAVSRVVELAGGHISLVTGAMCTINGIGAAFVGLYRGATTVLLPGKPAKELLAAVERHRVSHLFADPAILNELLRVPARDGHDLSTLTHVAYGGAATPRRLVAESVRALREQRLVKLYGLTELAGVASALADPEHRDDSRPHLLASVGRPVPGVEARVVDPDTGEDAPLGFRGEFWLRASRDVPGDWVRTGDVGHIDADGYLFVTDRLSDLIRSGETTVCPSRVEDVLATYDGVDDVAVVGVPHAEGERPVAFVVPAPEVGSRLDVMALLRHARERLAAHERPAAVALVEALPRASNGAVLRRQLRELHARYRNSRETGSAMPGPAL
jgi:acyl-CoA synthetase (AMP-forming)/AMP-acid ligase II